MDGIGEWLRHKREGIGLTIDDVSKKTKYPPEVIRKVEEGRPGVFPAEVYFNVFLKAYARALGLDPEEVLRARTSDEERASAAIRDLKIRSPARRRPFHGVRYVLIGVTIAAVAGYLVHSFSSRNFNISREIAVSLGNQTHSFDEMSPGAEKSRRNESHGGKDSLSRSALKTSEAAPESDRSEQMNEENVEGEKPGSSGPGTELCLEIIASGGFYVKISNGDKTIGRWLSRGEKFEICSKGDITIISLTNRDYASLRLNGRPYVLPDSLGKEVYDFVIPAKVSGK